MNELNKDDLAEKMFLEGKSITCIAKELNVDRGCLSIRLKKRGLEINQHCNKKKINSNVFNIIDTEEKAYWLGLLMADGSISKDNCIELTLKDKEHIEKFKTFLSSDHKIAERKIVLNDKEFISYRISFKDKHIVESLKSYGCVPNKTFKMNIPNICNELFRHWLRGYFDGDGCIRIGGERKHQSYITFSSGNIEILNDICTYINKNLNVTTDLYVRKSSSCYEIRTFNINNTSALLNYMYQDSNVYLDRKHDSYLQYCRLKTRLQKS